RIGIDEQKPTRPSQKAELVSLSTSHPWAMFCIQVPMLERKLPVQKSRKSRWRSARASGILMTVVLGAPTVAPSVAAPSFTAPSVTQPRARPEAAAESARGSAGEETRSEAAGACGSAGEFSVVFAVAPVGSGAIVKVLETLNSRKFSQ